MLKTIHTKLKSTILRLLLASAVALCAQAAGAKVTLGFKGEQAATVGIYIKDLNTGETVAENNALTVMSPASVMKVITTASVYSEMDHDFRFETKVYLTGSVSGGVCQGNLVIDACGDPTIDSGHFPGPSFCQEIVEAVTAAGITEFKGSVVVEQHMPEAGCIQEWEIEDVPWPYGAGLFGLNYRDNVYTLWPGTRRTSPRVPNLDLKVVKDKNFNLKRGINSPTLTVYTPNPASKRLEVNTTMYDPAKVFACELNDSLKAHGVTIATAAKDLDHRILLYVHRSPSLAEVITKTLVHSHNLFAEGLLRVQAPGQPRAQAIEKELQLWDSRGLDTGYSAVIDGSGLSRANRLSPRFIGDVLEWMAGSEYADYVTFFPKVGYDGTVKSFLKDTPLQGKLALKTGSMNAVQCYGGYKLDDAGVPTHVVVILVNSFYCDRASLRKSIEQFLLRTFAE